MTYGRHVDAAQLGVERNVLRYLPTTVAIRSEGPDALLARVQLAAARAGASVSISSGTPLPVGDHVAESADRWLERVARERPSRVRLVGGSASALAVALQGDPAVAVYGDDVTGAGRVEMLPFLREQTVTITNHRYGSPTRTFERFLTRQ
jgi:RHH-type proline utilization regulon transcriptional repressor/proline dehydrogenase/delta 1-pyrroline-5-carboxylate dehydrogenase